MSSKPSSRRRRRLLSLALLIAVILSPAVAVVADGLTDDVRPSDVAVVLGNKVNPDGRPSPMLQARLDEALALYRKGLFPTVMVSGGLGKEGFDEAAVMKAYLVARGVPAGAVITDNKGVNTWATAQNASALMRAHGWRSCLVVSQYFHISRTRLALRRQGVQDIRTAHARYFAVRDLYSIPREVAGYAAYLTRST
jgi:vancomycin permeability regulator SanA